MYNYINIIKQMSASVTLTKRGGTFKIVLKKELPKRNLKTTFKSKFTRNFKTELQKEFSNRNLKDTSKSKLAIDI